MNTIDTSSLVKVGDEFARQKFDLNNNELWSLTTFSLNKSRLDLSYTSSEDFIRVKVSLNRSMVEGMLENNE